MRLRELFVWGIAATLLLACKPDEPPPEPDVLDEPAPAEEEEAPEPTREAIIESIILDVPVSRLDLGEFPYFSLPEGYRAGETVEFDLTRAPFWVDNGVHWVNGRIYQAAIFAEPGRTFSEMALRDDIDFMITAVGGVKVSEIDRIPTHVATSQGLDEGQRNKFRVGLGHFYSRPVSTYLLRVPDGDVWIHFTSFGNGASLLMAKATPRIPVGRLLSGADLKTLIDMEGKAVVEVNFDVGTATIRADAVPQIDQIGELLRLDPELRLSVNGHTDSTGSEERNLALSQDRAEAVVRALVAREIDSGRLEARGYGDSEPIADNETTPGRARNRRVELVPIED